MISRLLGAIVVVAVLSVSGALAQTHNVQITSDAGGRLTIINAPGAAYTGQLSEQDRTYLTLAGQLANWTTPQMSALQNAAIEFSWCKGTLYKEADPADPMKPQYICTGAESNCTFPCPAQQMVGGGLGSLTLQVN